MQAEFDAMTPNPGIQILGVSQLGYEGDNAAFCVGTTIPWLQESIAGLVWGPWNVEFRDVVILDQANQKMDSYNLTVHALNTAGNYEALKAMLLSAAK